MKKDKIKKAKETHIKRQIPHDWWKLPLTILMAGGGLAICLIGNAMSNPIVISLGFFLILGGGLLFMTKRGELGTRILPGARKLKAPANVLVVYPGDIEFDYIKSPPGHQQRCVNDGKWYSVLIGHGKPREKLQEFVLPDDAQEAGHYDPREFANPVTMPANEKLFEPTPNMVKAIAVGVMGLAVCGLGIVIIAMGG